MSRVANASSVVMALCAVVLVGMAVMRRGEAGETSGEILGPLKSVEWSKLTSTGHRIGPADARIVMVEFTDFQCPFCAQYHNTVITPLRASYPDDFAVVIHHWPLKIHPDAHRAAVAAECAGRVGRFEQFSGLLYASQDSIARLSMDSVAARSGITDLTAFRACTIDDAVSATINEDAALAQQFGSGGTPSVIINRERFAGGGPSYERIRSMLEEK